MKTVAVILSLAFLAFLGKPALEEILQERMARMETAAHSCCGDCSDGCSCCDTGAEKDQAADDSCATDASCSTHCTCTVQHTPAFAPVMSPRIAVFGTVLQQKVDYQSHIHVSFPDKIWHPPRV